MRCSWLFCLLLSTASAQNIDLLSGPKNFLSQVFGGGGSNDEAGIGSFLLGDYANPATRPPIVQHLQPYALVNGPPSPFSFNPAAAIQLPGAGFSPSFGQQPRAFLPNADQRTTFSGLSQVIPNSLALPSLNPVQTAAHTPALLDLPQPAPLSDPHDPIQAIANSPLISFFVRELNKATPRPPPPPQPQQQPVNAFTTRPEAKYGSAVEHDLYNIFKHNNASRPKPVRQRTAGDSTAATEVHGSPAALPDSNEIVEFSSSVPTTSSSSQRPVFGYGDAVHNDLMYFRHTQQQPTAAPSKRRVNLDGSALYNVLAAGPTALGVTSPPLDQYIRSAAFVDNEYSHKNIPLFEQALQALRTQKQLQQQRQQPQQPQQQQPQQPQQPTVAAFEEDSAEQAPLTGDSYEHLRAQLGLSDEQIAHLQQWNARRTDRHTTTQTRPQWQDYYDDEENQQNETDYHSIYYDVSDLPPDDPVPDHYPDDLLPLAVPIDAPAPTVHAVDTDAVFPTITTTPTATTTENSEPAVPDPFTSEQTPLSLAPPAAAPSTAQSPFGFIANPEAPFPAGNNFGTTLPNGLPNTGPNQGFPNPSQRSGNVPNSFGGLNPSLAANPGIPNPFAPQQAPPGSTSEQSFANNPQFAGSAPQQAFGNAPIQTFNSFPQSFDNSPQPFGTFPQNAFNNGQQSFGSFSQSPGSSPQSFGNSPPSFGKQSFGNLPQSFGNSPQSFGNLPQSFGNRPQGFGAFPQSLGNSAQPFNSFPQSPQSFGSFAQNAFNNGQAALGNVPQSFGTAFNWPTNDAFQFRPAATEPDSSETQPQDEALSTQEQYAPFGQTTEKVGSSIDELFNATTTAL